jgi:hypothetical protein
MQAGVERPRWGAGTGVGPTVPVVLPAESNRERREKDRRRPSAPPKKPPPGENDGDARDDGQPGPDGDAHRIDIVV